ncbi:MAG: DNA adenine methylase [Spirochaetota bacterium]
METRQAGNMAIQVPSGLSRGLISYIGNKRRMLEPLAEAIAPLRRDSGETSFLDPFCGSGAVSRLARHLGFRVHASDWEPYAAVVTAASLENDPQEIDGLFAACGGVARCYERLNACLVPRTPYVSLHYAPRDTEAPRLGEERLFYTAENARFIDAVREQIDALFPGTAAVDDDSPAARARRIVLASLLHVASVHANTSGVFKAYHRGFGGLGGDALGRILRRMRLEVPAIPAGPRGRASRLSADAFLAGKRGDVCYLDPPYAGHQYGSNYFMLNTILLWDRPPVDDRRDESGRLLAKAGIRPDWVQTRSEFCSRRVAPDAMRRLLARIDARYLVVSYSSDGIIALDELTEMLAESGEVRVRAVDYTTYRGGRQSNTRSARNSEFIFVVDRASPPVAGRGGGVPETAARPLARSRVSEFLARPMVPSRLRAAFRWAGHTVHLSDGWSVESADLHVLARSTPPDEMTSGELDAIAEKLSFAACVDHLEELEVLLDLLWVEPANAAYRKRIGWCLHKVAHRKYRAEFANALAMVYRAMLVRPGVYAGVSPDVTAVQARAALRFG